MVIAEVASRVWPDGVDAVEPLGGGITNHNFKVTVGGQTVVLRIGGKDTELLGIDRRAEYEATLDVFFDLANFSINHELEPADDERLVAQYYGESRPLDLASLRLMRFMSDFREAMWGVVQQGISELDFDFVGYADEHFERLERTAASGEFRAALASYGRSD